MASLAAPSPAVARCRRALIIRHVPVEGVAGYRAPIEAVGYAIDRVDVEDPGFAALDLCSHDLVIMMGAPMGVYEADRYPWIACQMRRLRRRLDAGLPTLGVCFGAQLIAATLGGTVYRGDAGEIGFAAIAIHDCAREGPLRHLIDVPVLHWHSDSFTLPEGVEPLASSPAYVQAFRRGNQLLALQFHAEMGEDERFEAWLAAWPEAVVAAGSDIASLRTAHEALGPGCVAAGRAMIAEWLEGLD